MQTDWPIFVLTLEGDEERRQPLLDQLKEMGLQWRLIFGVDGRKGLPAEYEAGVDRNTAQSRLKRPMTDSEFACALSHRRIYELIISEGLSGAVVLEDDEVLESDFKDFYLGGLHRTETLILMDYGFARGLPWQKCSAGRWILHRVAYNTTCAAAYTVSRQVAYQLVEAATPVGYVSDWPIDMYRTKVWLISPRIAVHRLPGEGPSHLAEQRAPVERILKKRDPARLLELRYYRGLLRRRLARRIIG